MRLARNVSSEDRIRFHPSGWTAVPDQTMPMRADLHEYFEKDYNLDIKIWDNH